MILQFEIGVWARCSFKEVCLKYWVSIEDFKRRAQLVLLLLETVRLIGIMLCYFIATLFSATSMSAAIAAVATTVTMSFSGSGISKPPIMGFTKTVP